MKKITLWIGTLMLSLVLLVACGAPSSSQSAVSMPEASTPSSTQLTSQPSSLETENNSSQQERETMDNNESPTLIVQIGEDTFTATLYDNTATRALVEQLPLTLDMRELNGNEKVAGLPQSLPTETEAVGSIRTGDLMLYGSNNLVLFYESFSTPYSYTRLGAIENTDGLAEAVGSGDVEMTFRLAE